MEAVVAAAAEEALLEQLQLEDHHSLDHHIPLSIITQDQMVMSSSYQEVWVMVNTTTIQCMVHKL